jgi:hypothetical protein
MVFEIVIPCSTLVPIIFIVALEVNKRVVNTEEKYDE